MAEFIVGVKEIAYVLCFKLMGFTHIYSAFGSCASGETFVISKENKLVENLVPAQQRQCFSNTCPRHSAIRHLFIEKND